MGAEWFRGRQILGAALVCLVPASGSAHEASKSRYDYARHVRPVFERHCASCHRPGGIAPMSLMRYEDAIPWANAIKLMVLERRMPPWLPEEGVGSWRGAKGLTALELDLVVEWASGGTPKGEGSGESQQATPPLPREPQADVILSALRESVLGPEQGEKTECVVFPMHLEKGRALVSVELRPGNEAIVRSAVIYNGDSCREQDRPLATWLPGDGAFEMPRGSAEVLRGGASLSARILYRKTWLLDGKPARDRSRLALRFAKEPTAALAQVSLEAGTGTTFARPVRVVAVFPRGAHGASLRLDAVRPGGGRDQVLAIERFDPDWSAKYALSPPRELEAGTRLEAVQGGFWIDYLPEDPAANAKAARRLKAPPGRSKGRMCTGNADSPAVPSPGGVSLVFARPEPASSISRLRSARSRLISGSRPVCSASMRSANMAR